MGTFTRKKHRLWPPQSFVDLVAALKEFGQRNQLDIRFIIDLIPEEKQMAKRIESLCPNNITILCGPPNFQRFLAYVKRLNVLIAPNTGVMHLAAALNTPTVALFSGADPNDCGPYMHPERFRVVHAGQYDTNGIGIASIPIQPVADAVISFLPIQ